jgi:hypothetical protein
MATFTWIGANPFPARWTDPANWQVASAATPLFPNSATDVAIATANGADGFEYPIISGGAAIQLASLSSAGIAHVLVGGSQLGGTGSATLTAGSISVTSTALGGGLVGGPGSTITTPSLTVGPGAIIGGGGTFSVTSLVNSGIIQADGGNFNLGALTVTGGTITGTGSIEVDGPSTFDLGSATAETITVVVAPTQTANVIFENPGSFTGSLNLFNPQSHVNLFFKGQTPTGATFDSNTNSLIITGATGQIDKIPFGSNGISLFATPTSTLSGFGEVSIGPETPVTPVTPITPVTLGPQPVFRFFDTHDGGHFFTTSTAERDQVLATRNDMNFEGVGYKAVDPAGADPNAAPVFRFFDTHDGGHFFTTSTAERDQVLATRNDLKFEGVGYSEHTSQQAGDAPVYRFFETTSGGHFFTASAAERDAVQATRSDMRFEGIAFFAPT